MKIRIELDLSDESDAYDYKLFQRAAKQHSLIEDAYLMLRSHLKHDAPIDMDELYTLVSQARFIVEDE